MTRLANASPRPWRAERRGHRHPCFRRPAGDEGAVRPCAAARLSRLPHPRAAIKVELPRADFRPGVKGLSLIDDDSAVLAVGRPPALKPKAFERAWRETEIHPGLLGAEKGGRHLHLRRRPPAVPVRGERHEPNPELGQPAARATTKLG